MKIRVNRACECPPEKHLSRTMHGAGTALRTSACTGCGRAWTTTLRAVEKENAR